METSLKHALIKITNNDNVGVVKNASGLQKENIPMGHKVALENINNGVKLSGLDNPWNCKIFNKKQRMGARIENDAS